MSVRIESEYLGDLVTGLKHVPSGSTIVTNAPADNGGKGDLFSPTDLVAAAAGACMMTLVDEANQLCAILGKSVATTRATARDPQ